MIVRQQHYRCMNEWLVEKRMQHGQCKSNRARSLPSGATSAFAMNLHVDNLTIFIAVLSYNNSILLQSIQLTILRMVGRRVQILRQQSFGLNCFFKVIASNATIKNSFETTFSGYNTGETWKVDDDVIPQSLDSLGKAE